MAIVSSGKISLGTTAGTDRSISGEFGGTQPHALSEYYGVDAGVPGSGAISFSDFYNGSDGVALPPFDTSWRQYDGSYQSINGDSSWYNDLNSELVGANHLTCLYVKRVAGGWEISIQPQRFNVPTIITSLSYQWNTGQGSVNGNLLTNTGDAQSTMADTFVAQTGSVEIQEIRVTCNIAKIYTLNPALSVPDQTNASDVFRGGTGRDASSAVPATATAILGTPGSWQSIPSVNDRVGFEMESGLFTQVGSAATAVGRYDITIEARAPGYYEGTIARFLGYNDRSAAGGTITITLGGPLNPDDIVVGEPMVELGMSNVAWTEEFINQLREE